MGAIKGSFRLAQRSQFDLMITTICIKEDKISRRNNIIKGIITSWSGEFKANSNSI